jgi:methylated-DNA-[protein]-cysteine S-methyltransferase
MEGVMLAFDAVVAAPFGGIGVRVADGLLTELVYVPRSISPAPPVTPIAREAVAQLKAYMANADFRFDLPLVARGTDFQRRVWGVIAAIPRGEILTYGQVARQIRSAPRAVGQACGANWFPMVIPCHRVLAAGGIGGFAHHDGDGFHLGVKRWLLQHEQVAGYG